MTLAKALLAALLLPSAALACGPSPQEGYQGNEATVRELRNKNLVCSYNGVESAATLDAYAIYRCINSPIRVELAAFEERLDVSNIQKKADRYLLTVDKLDLPISCKIAK